MQRKAVEDIAEIMHPPVSVSSDAPAREALKDLVFECADPGRDYRPTRRSGSVVFPKIEGFVV